MVRHSRRAWAVGAIICVIVGLISASLLASSHVLVVVRTVAGVAMVVMLGMIHRANRAHKQHTLKQLDHITHLLKPQRNRSTADQASRRVH